MDLFDIFGFASTAVIGIFAFIAALAFLHGSDTANSEVHDGPSADEEDRLRNLGI